jgi:hypothetical protein
MRGPDFDTRPSDLIPSGRHGRSWGSKPEPTASWHPPRDWQPKGLTRSALGPDRERRRLEAIATIMPNG